MECRTCTYTHIRSDLRDVCGPIVRIARFVPATRDFFRFVCDVIEFWNGNEHKHDDQVAAVVRNVASRYFMGFVFSFSSSFEFRWISANLVYLYSHCAHLLLQLEKRVSEETLLTWTFRCFTGVDEIGCGFVFLVTLLSHDNVLRSRD